MRQEIEWLLFGDLNQKEIASLKAISLRLGLRSVVSVVCVKNHHVSLAQDFSGLS